MFGGLAMDGCDSKEFWISPPGASCFPFSLEAWSASTPIPTIAKSGCLVTNRRLGMLRLVFEPLFLMDMEGKRENDWVEVMMLTNRRLGMLRLVFEPLFLMDMEGKRENDWVEVMMLEESCQSTQSFPNE